MIRNQNKPKQGEKNLDLDPAFELLKMRVEEQEEAKSNQMSVIREDTP